ncbi:MAG: hypothetical protein U0796_00150 [Gemmatales bacterium]
MQVLAVAFVILASVASVTHTRDSLMHMQKNGDIVKTKWEAITNKTTRSIETYSGNPANYIVGYIDGKFGAGSPEWWVKLLEIHIPNSNLANARLISNGPGSLKYEFKNSSVVIELPKSYNMIKDKNRLVIDGLGIDIEIDVAEHRHLLASNCCAYLKLDDVVFLLLHGQLSGRNLVCYEITHKKIRWVSSIDIGISVGNNKGGGRSGMAIQVYSMYAKSKQLIVHGYDSGQLGLFIYTYSDGGLVMAFTPFDKERK